jgi:hypothetical protein
MEICPLTDGGVEFTSTITHEEVRPSVRLLERGHLRGQGLLRVCSWCQQVATPDGRWLPVEEAVASLRLAESGDLPGITHGICESCFAGMEAQLQRM